LIRTLSNSVIEVDIADGNMYQGTRFDRTGFITQVRLKHSEGYHTFCTFEKNDPNQQWFGGAGLCNEFGIFEGIGYDEAEVGEAFPKLGVGLLTKLDDTPYAFNRQYPARKFGMELFRGDQYLQYDVHPSECRGYAVRMHKRISLNQATISLDYTIENVGTKSIHTSEYVHNFLSIDRRPVGPEYRLAFNFPIEVAQMEEEYTPRVLDFQASEIHLKHMPEREFYCQLKGYEHTKKVRWELLHVPSQVGIWEASSFPVSRIAVWGASHVISPEVFIDIHLEPGEALAWSRQFGFISKS
jgi:hypothetical protein